MLFNFVYSIHNKNYLLSRVDQIDIVGHVERHWQCSPFSGHSPIFVPIYIFEVMLRGRNRPSLIRLFIFRGRIYHLFIITSSWAYRKLRRSLKSIQDIQLVPVWNSMAKKELERMKYSMTFVLTLNQTHAGFLCYSLLYSFLTAHRSRREIRLRFACLEKTGKMIVIFIFPRHFKQLTLWLNTVLKIWRSSYFHHKCLLF